MLTSKALNRYLQRHIEPNLPPAPSGRNWQHVLVIPAYRERAELVERLAALQAHSGHILIILVLNRPEDDTDPTANSALRDAITRRLPQTDDGTPLAPPTTLALNPKCDLYVLDLEKLRGVSSANQGVGLARKTGCDLAIKWMDDGAITGDWIYSSDADAALPADYFERLPTFEALAKSSNREPCVVATLPFTHTATGDRHCDQATALYELQLHHYVLGLEHANSPYAYHTLGSALAITADAYVKVRGFPKRAGGEDFYLLNKAAKLGGVARPGGECIGLESRASLRVPFGTGPAVTRIMNSEEPQTLALFYHPACFDALRATLATLPALYTQASSGPKDPVTPNTISAERVLAQLLIEGLSDELAVQAVDQLIAMGLPLALEHCARQSKSLEQYMRQFHQWFDGFKTLKFIHGLRDRGWPKQSLQQLQLIRPELWPTREHSGSSSTDQDTLRAVARAHWSWTHH